MAPPTNVIPLPASYLPTLLAADTAIYPSSGNLTLPRLESWIAAAPSFSLLFPSGGIIVSLPLLAPYWRLFVAGDLDEWEIDDSMLLQESSLQPGSRPVEVGIHSWHIERNDDARGFGKRAFAELQRRLEDVGARVIGWSALAVTADGVGLCRSLGWKERAVDQARGGGKLMWFNGPEWSNPTQ